MANAGMGTGDTTARTGAIIAIVGGAALVLGSFLPWISLTAPFVGTVTKSGAEGGDGWFTVIGGIVAVLAGVSILQSGVSSSKKAVLVAVALGAGALAIYEFVDISDRFAEARAEADSSGSVFGVTPSDLFSTSYGIGLYMIVAGAVVTLIGALQLRTSPAPRSPKPL